MKGVTFGSFLPRVDGAPFPEFFQIKRDLVEIKEAGLNVLRTYSPPPPELLDLAAELELRVIVGVHYEDWRYETTPGPAAHKRVLERGRAAIREAMSMCAGRPEVLAISVGNEVPGDVVRTHGIRSVEKVLGALIAEVHRSDPEMLATYCNFPTTEYLHVVDQDLVCMNVFLETPDAFRRYLKHLQVSSGDVPLVITELGLASRIHGEDGQAGSLLWQLRIVDECGAAGATVFSWTDEWAVAGTPIEEWGFGITDRDRRPKPAFKVVSEWAGRSIIDLRRTWPRITVVVCAYNAAPYTERCLRSLASTHYPNLEVIVCDDGSTDGTVEIARGFPFKVLELEHGGLSRARNAGIEAATGSIVAFLDSDAFCHPEWPFHLALSLETEGVVGTGGPNLPVPDVEVVERAIADSPGQPVHVLLTDDRAEHVPGCNMAFDKSALLRIKGFDPTYTAAGDDVDVCWKLLDAGHQIAFSQAAQVRHHRRDSIKAYLKQQKGYGRAERLVASAHRHRFNRLGQARWSGFIYGGPQLFPGLLHPLVYHGYQGTAPYQNVVHRRGEIARNWATALLPLFLPLLVLAIAASGVWSLGWQLPVAIAALPFLYGLAVSLAARTHKGEPHPFRYRAIVGFLHAAQPLVRSWGRLASRIPKSAVVDSEWTHEINKWRGDRDHWLQRLKHRLIETRCRVRVGDPHDSWDLQASIGAFIAVRINVAVVWNWTPISRVSWRFRLPFWVVQTASVPAAFAGNPWALLLSLEALVLAAAEFVLLRRRVDAAFQKTLQGAEQ